MSVNEIDYEDQFFKAFLAGAEAGVGADYWSDEELWGFFLEWLANDE